MFWNYEAGVASGRARGTGCVYKHTNNDENDVGNVGVAGGGCEKQSWRKNKNITTISRIYKKFKEHDKRKQNRENARLI